MSLDQRGQLGVAISVGTIGGGLKRPTRARLWASGFAAVVNHPHCRGIPKIMETPKEERVGPWRPAKLGAERRRKLLDVINLQRLKDLIDAGEGAANRPVPGARSGPALKVANLATGD